KAKYRLSAPQVVEISRASSFAHAAKPRRKLTKITSISLNVRIVSHRSFSPPRCWTVQSEAMLCSGGDTQRYQSENCYSDLTVSPPRDKCGPHCGPRSDARVHLIHRCGIRMNGSSP